VPVEGAVALPEDGAASGREDYAGQPLLGAPPRHEGEPRELFGPRHGPDWVDRGESEAPDLWRGPADIRIDTSDRAAVIREYLHGYRPALAVAAEWNGSVAACRAGQSSTAYREATRYAINYFRAMTGQVGRVLFRDDFNAMAQEAALMMLAGQALSHTPGADWPCYTELGRQAAGASNLAIGASGAAAIALYMADPGEGNNFLGHRRWVLFPPTLWMGTGDTGSTNALVVFGAPTERPVPPAWVAWPPQGFVPYPIVFEKWSLSYPGAVFTGADVTMTVNGRVVPVEILATEMYGFGDNTVAWRPRGLEDYTTRRSLPGDDVVDVTVGNVLVPADDNKPSARNFSYRVTIIDPLQPGPESPTPSPTAVPPMTLTATPGPTVSATVAPTASGTAMPTTAFTATATDPPYPPPAEPTRTASPTTMVTATTTRTATAAPDASGTADHGGARPFVCPNLRVPQADIEAALADPERISGWGELCNPNVPYHPISNGYRTALRLRNPNLGYHPVFNSLVFGCGCR